MMTDWLNRRLLPGIATLALVATLVAWQPNAQADGADGAGAGFDPAQTEAIHDIVRQYLLDNPEILIEALEVYEQRRQEMAEQRQREAIVARATDLGSDPGSPVLGNPDGDVLVVEFFDYRCPYCKTVAGDLREAVIADGKIRLVMKEFPILGPQSVYAARAALAAHKQDRYEDFHFALMETEGELDDKTVLRVAEDLELDTAQLQKDMFSKEIEDSLQRTFELAEALEVGGTPAFIVGDQLFPGALGMNDLLRIVEELRSGSG